ncbi:MFS transporter [Enemella evansiae]|uniref:MFS transporter n=1 Tax=Enemella evansiae TaxID=2016499 RepID=UPI000B9746C4|nr:MFS transporter [Enemella evansiae]OYO14173.1 MFS transporter [Enemella evansiae]TDO91934.1 putative MFS family arabinose efflux permease [Enemella evansiae]
MATDSTTNAGSTTAPGMNTPQMRRILFSSFMGSTIEMYDFLLYALATSLVFNKVFFANMSDGLAAVAGFATFAVGYLARPIGGWLFGQFGDTLGRKKMLVITMLMMGLASMAIGLLPDQRTIGVAAPLLLLLLRVIQGIGLGGEIGGAVLVAVEHAPGHRRGFAASFANLGGPAGSFLAAFVLGLFSKILSPQDFLAWGWRIPFLFSVVLLAIGMMIRLQVAETPLFTELQQRTEARRTPAADVFTKHWKALVIGVLAGIAGFATQGFMSVWAVQRATTLKVPQAAILDIKAWAPLGMFVVMAFTAWLSDHVGRRAVMLTTCVIGAVLCFPLLNALDTGTIWGTALAIIAGQAIMQGALFGPYTAFLSELFPTEVRYTGTSLAYQTASTLGAGFTPLIAAELMRRYDAMLPIQLAYLAAFAITAVAVLIAREGRKVDLRNPHVG